LGLAQLACAPDESCPFTEPRQANHEDYTQKIILQSSMTPVLEKALAPWGIKPLVLAGILDLRVRCDESFFKLGSLNLRPILHQMVSSELDVDRMDYLTRDSFYAGVSYGKFDLSWILANLTYKAENGNAYLAFAHRALYAFEDFLISRFHMFLMVYFHHKSVIYDEILARYLRSAECDYEIPADIERYVFFDDYHLYTHLSTARNPWAKRIFHKNPYKMVAEFHSGILPGPHGEKEQKAVLDELLARLKKAGTDYILKTSTGELSSLASAKAEGSPIYVRYHDKVSPERFIPLSECTDLFRRYPESRSITRVYVENAL
jgi:HD superfamily phosphohydrolase